MFGWFKNKEPECNHDYHTTDYLYSDVRTDYNNGHDHVEAYKMQVCSQCGDKRTETVIKKAFPVYRPEWPRDRMDFIERLESNGFSNMEDYLIERATKGASQ